MKLLLVAGSISNISMNRKVLNNIVNLFGDKYEFTTVDLRDIPFYNEDIELDPPASVKESKKKVKEADGVIIITPEYNRSMSGVLKNWLDWTSRSGGVMGKKPVFMMGASNGNFGTVRAQLHLREVLISPGLRADVFNEKEMYFFRIQDSLDENGVLIDEKAIGRIEKNLAAFAEYIESKK